MQKVTLSTGLKFNAASGVSILDAGALAQVPLNYSCRVGRCSACKCKVTSGITSALQTEEGLSDTEKEEGWILTCVRSAETDVALEVEDLGGITLPPPKFLPCRISSIKKLAPNVIRVRLRLPPSSDFVFLPGQYIDVIGPNGVRRSYSLANASFAGKWLELHIREVEGGAMSRYWFNDATDGDLLRLHGPLGSFFLREAMGTDLIFMATGTGIAPVKAMLESISTLGSMQSPRSVTIFWGARRPEDLYLDMDTLFGDHTFVPVLSRPPLEWVHDCGYIQDALIARNVDLGNATVYACGSNAMIRDTKTRLVEAGLASPRFYSDAFVCSKSNVAN